MVNVDSLWFDSIQRHVLSVESNVAELHQQLSESQGYIANEIAASDRFLSVASIVLAAVSIVLGAYITWCQARVAKIKKEVEKKEEDLLLLRAEVETTNKQINTDLSSLYKRLRREETITLLKRLIDVPEDIDNISGLLLSRDLFDEDFKLLLQAFSKLPEDARKEYVDDYRGLFFQHFAGLSIKEERLRSMFIDGFEEMLSLCFRNDVIKSTKDMVASLLKMSPHIRSSVILP